MTHRVKSVSMSYPHVETLDALERKHLSDMTHSGFCSVYLDDNFLNLGPPSASSVAAEFNTLLML